MKNETYDFLKNLALKYLPALEFFVLTVFKIWNLPYGTEIGATIAALATALGIVLGISTYNYNKIEKYDENAEIEDTVEDEDDFVDDEASGDEEDD